MAPVKPFFACLLTVAALPHLKAWAPTDSNCHRLVPLQITSVVTPCVYPCLLLSPYNGYGDIVLRKEVDGTPCKITGSQSLLQESKCVNGFCQFLDFGLQLKRTKRETRLLRKRRGLVKKVKQKLNKRKEKRKRKKAKKKAKKNAGNVNKNE
uniref:Basic tail secreted protein n=1 Tax=Rhipicephalus appendiculatus TaxID=34631 RepID=A0A131YQD0_RHIAP